ncbi:hypothetical protein KDRO_A06480 [Kluyveromyces lactis]|nr:hypothetical protein KDRO_A06480 [Kluyveromyces lactis]
MDLRYTFWSPVSTVSVDSLYDAITQDIQSIMRLSQFLNHLNNVWNASLLSMKKVPDPKLTIVGEQVVEKITESLKSYKVDTTSLDHLLKQYESLLGQCKENKGRDASLIKGLKQWKTLKLQIQEQSMAYVKDKDDHHCPVAGGILRFPSRTVMFKFLRWLKDDIKYSKRFIPISKLPNEYFSGNQLIESIRKQYPDSVVSLYQQEILGQWFLSEGYMAHYNDLLGVRKAFSCNGYYCWQELDQQKAVKYNLATVNGLIWEQWSKYTMHKLQFETNHFNQMDQLAQLREELVQTMKHFNGTLEETWHITSKEGANPNSVTVQSMYEQNMGSIGFYVTSNEPIIKYNSETTKFEMTSPIPDDITANSLLHRLLDEIENEDHIEDVKRCWITEFDLINWHRIKEDLLRRWMHVQSGDKNDYASLNLNLNLTLDKKVLLLKGWLIELHESIIPSEICEESVRNNQSILKSFQESGENLRKDQNRIRCIVRVLRHLAWLRETSREALDDVLSIPLKIPVTHYFMRCQHQVPNKIGAFKALLLQSVEEGLQQWYQLMESTPAVPPVLIDDTSLSLSQPPRVVTASVADVAAPAPAPPPPHHVTTDFIPKPFKASSSGSNASSTTSSTAGSHTVTTTADPREKRRSGTPLLQIMPDVSSST